MTENADDVKNPWTVIDKLANLQEDEHFKGSLIIDRTPDLEACLTRVLRPHDEAGFQSPDDYWMIDLRSQLDEALRILTFREIRSQLDLLNERLPAVTETHLAILFRSDAFLRYLSAYLYFGIRFLARGTEFETDLAGEKLVTCADSNVRHLSLLIPPTLIGMDGGWHFDNFVKCAHNDFTAPIETALKFLDDFHPRQRGPVQYELEEPSEFELWLRGLRPENEGAQKARFEEISIGLAAWANARSDFYLSLQPQRLASYESDETSEGNAPQRPAQGWLVTHPVAARLALADIYWIARLLRADVSANADVTYHRFNWLHLLRFHSVLEGDLTGSHKLEKAEEALRSVFDFVCDLIQNSVELTRAEERRIAIPDESAHLPKGTENWRVVFDEELDEVARQRKIRHFRDPSLPPEASTVNIGPAPASNGTESTAPPSTGNEGVNGPAGSASSPPPPLGGKNDNQPPDSNKGWSKRITTGDRPFNLIGLAFSGGGIRSATFNLGVLQGLQELDLLRHTDYLSTVSGGGFLGSWLVGNVRRSAHWLGRLTDWSDSIAHLRAYSNYLAPRTGILSADTWNLANSWFRNAFLIQLTGLVWLFALLLLTLVALHGFLFVGQPNLFGHSMAAYLEALAGCLLVGAISFHLYGTSDLATHTRSRRGKWVRRVVVAPAWVGSCALAAQLWAHAPLASQGWDRLKGLDQYSKLFLVAWKEWYPILGSSFVALLIITAVTLRRHRAHALWISPVCTFVLYLELIAVFLAFREWSKLVDMSHGIGFVLGPFLVLLAFAICVLLLIGFTGRNTNEARREWWTRMGTWLGIFAMIYLFVCGVGVLGPSLLWHIHDWAACSAITKGISWTAVLGWLGTVISGLLAGKSSKTTGDGTGSPGLEILARVGGFLFIVGSFLLGSTLLYMLLFELFAKEASVFAVDPIRVICGISTWKIIATFLLAFGIGWLFSWRFEINIFGLNQFYRNRLVRCYLGATRWSPGVRKPNPFTKFDFNDDLLLSRFRTDSPGVDEPKKDTFTPECGHYRGPLPIINCALNLAGSSDLALNTRHSASFTLTPLRCGSSRPRVGYAPTRSDDGEQFADGVPLGQAVSISGAAVSSNMGYNTSPLVAFLLTMFNVRLGWWFPNPGKPRWNRRGLNFSLLYLVLELLGIADEKSAFLNVSDGGHFENLGIYELIRRRCKLIIACDAECDEQLHFGGLGNMIRICQTDFGANIDIDVKSIRPQKEGLSLAHCAVGTIKYNSGELGRLVYIKASMTGDEDVSIAQYRSSHPSFPHESTSNQFYSEDQFESYRKLGLHVIRNSFKGNLPGDDPLLIAERMADVLTPAGCTGEAFLRHTAALRKIWEKFRSSSNLLPFMNELMMIGQKATNAGFTDEELCIGLELIQLMEDVFLDLRLDDFWEHPDNRGWAILFMRWARSPRFRLIWEKSRRTFGIRFEYFCHARLGLTRDRPIVRV